MTKPIKVKLPELAKICPLCKGHGYYKQSYCDAPSMHGDCDMCKGMQFVYAETGKPAPLSLVSQICTMNGFPDKHPYQYIKPGKWANYIGHFKACYEDIPPLFEVKP